MATIEDGVLVLAEDIDKLWKEAKDAMEAISVSTLDWGIIGQNLSHVRGKLTDLIARCEAIEEAIEES